MQETLTKNTVETEKILQIPTCQIIPNPNQPRKTFSQESIIKLADSIKQHGIIQPITVRKQGELYEIVSGERRLRAAKELNMPSVPCIVISINDEKSAEIAIIENLIREDLNIFEQATAIEALIDTYGLTQEQVAARLSNSQSFIANKLRLLRLSQAERDIILQNKLSERHARALLRIFDQETRYQTLVHIVENGLNVSNTEAYIDNLINTTASQEAQKPRKEHRLYKDTSSFCLAINRALDQAKSSNLEIKSRKIVGESFTEITIIIPNNSEQPD